MEKTLFTIGYEGLSQKEFIATLAAAKVRIVFDVRELPLSRKPGFSKRGLADALGRSAWVVPSPSDVDTRRAAVGLLTSRRSRFILHDRGRH